MPDSGEKQPSNWSPTHGRLKVEMVASSVLLLFLTVYPAPIKNIPVLGLSFEQAVPAVAVQLVLFILSGYFIVAFVIRTMTERSPDVSAFQNLSESIKGSNHYLNAGPSRIENAIERFEENIERSIIRYNDSKASDLNRLDLLLMRIDSAISSPPELVLIGSTNHSALIKICQAVDPIYDVEGLDRGKSLNALCVDVFVAPVPVDSHSGLPTDGRIRVLDDVLRKVNAIADGTPKDLERFRDLLDEMRGSFLGESRDVLSVVKSQSALAADFLEKVEKAAGVHGRLFWVEQALLGYILPLFLSLGAVFASIILLFS